MKRIENRIDLAVLGLAGCHDGKRNGNKTELKLHVHRVDQTLLPAQVDSFVGCSLHCALHPPAEIQIGNLY